MRTGQKTLIALGGVVIAGVGLIFAVKKAKAADVYTPPASDAKHTTAAKKKGKPIGSDPKSREPAHKGTVHAVVSDTTKDTVTQLLGPAHKDAPPSSHKALPADTSETVAQRTKRIADESVKEVQDAWAGKPAATAAHAVAAQDPTKPAPTSTHAAAPKAVKLKATHPTKPAQHVAAVLAQHGVSEGKAHNDDGAKILRAAQELAAYIHKGGRDRQRVSDWQRIIGLDPDGVVMQETKHRVEAVLSRAVQWPAGDLVPTGAAPKPANALQAANDLHAYVKVFGGHRVARVEVYQRAMGVDLSGGGVGNVGPKTKAKYKKITGKGW